MHVMWLFACWCDLTSALVAAVMRQGKRQCKHCQYVYRSYGYVPWGTVCSFSKWSLDQWIWYISSVRRYMTVAKPSESDEHDMPVTVTVEGEERTRERGREKKKDRKQGRKNDRQTERERERDSKDELTHQAMSDMIWFVIPDSCCSQLLCFCFAMFVTNSSACFWHLAQPKLDECCHHYRLYPCVFPKVKWSQNKPQTI